jgi:hypothetical protein
MTTRRVIIGSIVIVVLAVVWYLFRPETLFISKTVNEPFPGDARSASGR